MKNLLRLFIFAIAIAAVYLVIAIGMARHDVDLLAPVNLALCVIAAAVYLTPAALAIRRHCLKCGWVVAADVIFGWTIVGWFAAIIWALSCKSRVSPPVLASLPAKSPGC